MVRAVDCTKKVAGSSLAQISDWKTHAVRLVNRHLINFEEGKKAGKGDDWALPFIYSTQDIVGLYCTYSHLAIGHFHFIQPYCTLMPGFLMVSSTSVFGSILLLLI